MARFYKAFEKSDNLLKQFGVKADFGNQAYDLGCRLYQKIFRYPVLVDVPLEICTGFLGFQFNGWHYLVELFKEHDLNPHVRVDESVLADFHTAFQVQSSFDFVRHFDDKVEFKPPFGIFPWGNFFAASHEVRAREKDLQTSRFCGPSSPELIEQDFHNSLEVYRSLKQEGYRPWRRSFIGGTFLKRKTNEFRYVILQGNHRSAALAHLGYSSFQARMYTDLYHTINEEDVDEWFYVRNGECSRRDALAYFNAYFELTGFEQARACGLVEREESN